MALITLIAAPGGLPTSRATALAASWGCTPPAWLAENEACQMTGTAPEGAWEALQADGIDLCVQDASPAPIKLLLADMDSTMIGQECVDELADLAGVGPRVAGITARDRARRPAERPTGFRD